MNVPAGYIALPGGYCYAPLRVGTALRNPDGREVYFQPGDDSDSIRDTIASLEEIPENKRATITDMALGEYFA